MIGQRENKEIEIAVRDNGSGLPEHADLDKTRGISLHLVKGLVKKSAGR